MKKITITILLFFTIISFISCDSQSEKEIDSRFFNAYKEIYYAREIISDSLVANDSVQAIIKRNGFTNDEFQEVFFKLGKERPLEFSRILDSIRYITRMEIIELDSTNENTN